MFLSFYYGKTRIFGCFFSSELNIKPPHTSTQTLRRLDSAFGKRRLIQTLKVKEINDILIKGFVTCVNKPTVAYFHIQWAQSSIWIGVFIPLASFSIVLKQLNPPQC